MSAVTEQVRFVDRYTATDGRALMTGVQALVRSVLDQRRFDVERGMRTAAFVSGYQGSPLGGIEREIDRIPSLCDDLEVVFRAGLNEELAATAVNGTQLLDQAPGRRFDGVTGYWFGKNPGLDRAADAIRHGVLGGTQPLGGAVAWIGDDPGCKSSTLPSASEELCRSLRLPLLAPSTVAEVVELGLHAVALSRHAGVWAGLKIVADVADASATVELDALRAAVPDLGTRPARPAPTLLGPGALEAERDLVEHRLTAVLAYARAARLNRVVADAQAARLTIVAAGASFAAVRRALVDLGLDDEALGALGVRLVKLAMSWPLDRDEVRRLLTSSKTVLVVEDKTPFVETQIKEAYHGDGAAPTVVGKRDADGGELLPAVGAVSPDHVAAALGRLLAGELVGAQAEAHLRRVAAPPTTEAPGVPARSPYFCSGCPHNLSTQAADDELVGAGIGCHVMITLEPRGRGHVLGMTQMGGEGAQFIGLAPFTDDGHFTQNVGDGTFHHSGSLAVRAAVAARVPVTFKLLYNDAVAMTGGQAVEGRLDIPGLTRWCAIEGVERVVVTTPDVDAYRDVALDPLAEVRDRSRLPEVERELAAVDGVTVIIHDDRCASEERRLRKRGVIEAPTNRVWINERVCEGCGDCGEKSTCLSVLPVDTPLGRKTQIHQGSCNQDFACLSGDCPSFVVVEGEPVRPQPLELPFELADPVARRRGPALVRLAGIGGTGVVTLSQVLQVAAHLDGLPAAGLDQIGLAQKGGPVTSDVSLGAADVPLVTRGSIDVLLGLDLLGAARRAVVDGAGTERTIAVLNATVTPTAPMVVDVDEPPANVGRAVRAVRRATRADELLLIDAGELAEELFADHMPTGMILVGAALQHGCLPVSPAALEQAIELNGTAVDANVAALRWGRAAAQDPEAVRAALAARRVPAVAPTDPAALRLVQRRHLPEALEADVAWRVGDLVGYQSVRYAQSYLDRVADVARRERLVDGADDLAVTRAYAAGLHKLMTYKDEYEVARLHLDPTEHARRKATFGSGAKVKIMLHPPLLRALGMDRKIACGSWIRPLFRILVAARRVRGTRVDPFGRAEVRRLERALIAEYDALIGEALDLMTAANRTRVAELAALTDLVRGYEEIKVASVERFRTRAAAQLDELRTRRETSVRLPVVMAT